MAPYSVKRFNRRTLIVNGYLMISILLGLLAFFIQIGQGKLAVMTIYAFVMNFSLTVGATLWIYVPEILNDKQFGFAMTFHYCQAVEISASTEYLLYKLRPQGMFLFYSSINFLGFLFFYTYLKETKGLTDKQKKELYMPEEFKEAEIELSTE